MKRIMNPRTVRMALDKAEKRLAEIETEMAELQAERDTINQLRAALFGQLHLPMPLTATEPAPGQSVMVESGDCFWATGGHEHKVSGDDVTCLAPEEQRREK